MLSHASHLDWIDAQQQRMSELLVQWASINSGSLNLTGLETCAAAVMSELDRLRGRVETIALPPQRLLGMDGRITERSLGRLIRAVKRESVPLRVLLGIHLDTVYGEDHPFQQTTLEGNRLRGPGVADAKGGIVVMLTALEALERTKLADNIGWELLINPDEELGSPGSAGVWAAAARRNHLGLLFEPAHEDGALVSARKGSGNFTVVVSGRSAHAGRNPHEGRNAIEALVAFISRISTINLPSGMTVNVGQIQGGTAANVVPDQAMCRFNVRVESREQQTTFQRQLDAIIADINRRDGIRVQVSGEFTAPPKTLDNPTHQLLEHVADCGRALGIQIHWRTSGGVCDGNRLAAAGLPNIDSLGVRGGAIHSPDEFVCLDSLAERAKLTALLLMRLAAGEIRRPEAHR